VVIGLPASPYQRRRLELAQLLSGWHSELKQCTLYDTDGESGPAWPHAPVSRAVAKPQSQLFIELS